LFERIIIFRQTNFGIPIDLGFLAECLVFYNKVRVVADVEIFRSLVRCCGPEELLELLNMGVLEIEFLENMTGIATVETNIGQLHDFKSISSNVIRYQQISRKLFDELAGPSGRGANKFFRRFDQVIERSTYPLDVLSETRNDLLDSTYVEPAIKSLLSLQAPEYVIPEPLIFKVKAITDPGQFNNSLNITTNIDFESANHSYHLHTPKEHSSLSPAYLMCQIADTRRDLVLGCKYQSEFSVGPTRGLIAACKFAEILSKATQNTNALNLFQEAVIDDLPKIREVVNSGQRTFRDVIRLVQAGQKFKDWLKNNQGGEELRKSYCQEVARVEWADKLPQKSLRWLIITAATTGIGFAAGPLAGTALATALSAADAFLLDKMIKGWKPNQFIEGPLKQFLHIK
jgi:hypothetical protein